MKQKLRELREKWRGNEKLQRWVYLGCTIAAIALSTLILVSIAHGEVSRAADPSEPPSTQNPSVVSSAPDEGESLPLVDPSPSDVAEPVSLDFEISDSEASGLIQLALRDKMELKNVSAHFSEPDNLTVTVEITRDALCDFLEQENSKVPGILTMLLPDSFELTIGMGIYADGKGSVELEPREFAAFGVELTKYLPASLVNMVSDAINSSIPAETPIQAVEVRDGSAVFTLEL